MALFLTILFLLLSALFSGLEIAFVSSNKLRIELNKETGNAASKIIAKYNEDAPTFITALLIGNNIALILFSSYMSNIIDGNALSFIGNSPLLLLLVQTLITTIVVLIFGEFFPKALFRISPYRALLLFALPFHYLIYWILKPIAFLISWLSKSIIKLLMPNKYNEEQETFTSVDLEHYIKEVSSGSLSNDDDDELNSDIFEKALYLKEIKVKECMVPRMEIQSVEVNNSLEEIRKLFIESKHSRLIVYENDIDNILGYIHHIDFLNKPKNIKEIIYDVTIVPENMSARDLLTIFTKEHKTMAQVVDEYGGTAGIVTLEDLIEEIFGEIQDEHDDDEFIEKQLSENEYIFSGRLEIDYINEKYNLDIPAGEYETLAGYVVVNHEDIPDIDENIYIGNFKIHILSASNNRIETLQIKKLDVGNE